MAGSDSEPHVPIGRDEGGSWLYAPKRRLTITPNGERVVCHACGRHLRWISPGHLASHGLDRASYREKFDLPNGGLMAPETLKLRVAEGARRYRTNPQLRDALDGGRVDLPTKPGRDRPSPPR